MSFPLSDTLSRFELSGEKDLSSLISVFCVGVSSNHFVKHGPENSEHKPDFGKKCYMALWRLAGIYSGNVGERDARAHLGADRGRAVPRLTSLVPARLRWGADPGGMLTNACGCRGYPVHSSKYAVRVPLSHRPFLEQLRSPPPQSLHQNPSPRRWQVLGAPRSGAAVGSES